ncbi:Clan CD, family C14, metacaspase-like cysteine peptidase [Tritrichomonas foetus]|uniref:Clan CD, family C14, metacaspase-like cysteine peptidase n=1 Tax=Tritrichomonas foetus TaxID=1144522 RepID=A0A1J4K2V9_9EUKA|nr:Clan CD, family C14, metacaspase-like cysteine peptidase [Tritrichomonas foetus]|eukprot:OHT05719.1 Clan CD, family C14, metacaspase-like cysteine peptidase [Tritrichomonas foetus]
MGCAESEVDNAGVYEERAAKLGDNFTKDQFQKARACSTIDAVLSDFKKIGKYLNQRKPDSVPKNNLDKVCFLMCNTYTRADYHLGVGPLNDAYTVAQNHHNMGFQIYFLHNSTKEEFLAFLEFFLKNTKKELTVFFTGHGASVKDKNGDESDGFDEAMVFDKGFIVDDDLALMLKNADGKCRVILLTDCCHSGSIWDIQSSKKTGQKLPPNIISLSAAKDSQTAKQTTIGKKSQGIFTFYFWKFVNENPKITPKQLESKINVAIKKFNQCFVFASTSKGMENKPIFI